MKRGKIFEKIKQDKNFYQMRKIAAADNIIIREANKQIS